MFLPFQKPQTLPQSEPIAPNESSQFKRWKSFSNSQFILLSFAVGVGASNFFRPYPKHLVLFVIATGISGLAFMFFPIEKDYKSLFRLAGLAIICGAVITWWDLLLLLQWHHFLAIGIIVTLGLFAIGSWGNRR